MPNDGITQDAYAKAEARLKSLPKTKGYFKAYEDLLRSRSTYVTRMPNAPYYAVYNVGSYSFAPFKVIWAEQSGTFAAAVANGASVPLAGKRPYVPDHKIFFVEFQTEQPAYFLCGLLNATAVREFVESHNISIQVGDIFKHMSIPEFDRADSDHKLLAALAKQAHGEHDDKQRGKTLAKIRALGDKILGI